MRIQKRRTSALRESCPHKFSALLALILFLWSISPSVLAEDFGNLWGLVSDDNQNPIQNAKISLILKNHDFKKILLSDSSGLFRVSGLPLGCYTISFEAKGYQSHVQEEVYLEPSQSLYLRANLRANEKKEASFSKVLYVDYSNSLYQTIITESQIKQSPTAHNVWSLIENQDLSATTNRIDVGGLWGIHPALFSSRGSCSWTQNIYRLNGMDVTDPYWTGMPLIIPDLHSIQFTQLINAGQPLSALSPGAYFNILTHEGTDRYRGEISAFFIHRKLQSTNISPALEAEGLNDSHSFNHLTEGNFTFSGPLIPRKLHFFTSLSAFHVSRDIAEFEEEDKSSIQSGFLSLNYRLPESSFHFLWTGQNVTHGSYGAGRNVPFSATSDRKEIYNIIQGIWKTRIKDIHFIKAGVCFAQGDIRSDYQDHLSGQHGVEIFKDIPTGTAPFAVRDQRSSITFLGQGESLVSGFLKAHHRFEYGVQAQYCHSFSRKEIRDNLHLHFFEGLPLEVIRYNTPVRHSESALHLNFFAQDSVTLSNHISFFLGCHLALNHGWLPSQDPNTVFSRDPGADEVKNHITWFILSPRLGLIFPLSKSRSSALRMSIARYYFTLPLHFLTYGSPSSLGGLVYSWNDLNTDNQFQEGEAGALLRREGPFFSGIDPDLKRPYTNEFSISFIHTFGSNWHLTVGGFYRENRNLVETLNTGVTFSSYQPGSFFDIGDDRIPNSRDDLEFTVYNQNIGTLGQDFFLLTNPDSETRVSTYHGFDVTLVKKYSSKFNFFLSLTAIRAVGITSPGNTEWENDDGTVGTLYDNPNTLINAEGRLRFDRGYTGRIGVNFMAPFGLRIGCVVKYYDGQPFARKIIVTGMNQGPFIIQAHPRGVARYEYNRTVDIRLEKPLNFNQTRMRIILDVFNLINRNLATEENEWTGPEFPLRFATEIQSPRVFRLGLVVEF
jgi:hypothetical protein